MGCTRLTIVAVATVLVGCSSDGGAVSDGNEPEAPVIQEGTLIGLSSGQLEGEVAGGSRRFFGVPFAAPPVGALRWKSPEPVAAWDGVLDATELPKGCAQTASLTAPASDEEDCLYLNVWTPEPAPKEPLPVMVWFHGGGNTSGSISNDIPLGVGGLFYDGQTLAESHGVVVVTSNYRLGALGFFSHPELGSESGNQGLKDQKAALEWVRDNIGAFGGDSKNVTIFGESAGSLDVCLHVAAPSSRGLFHRAISQSGGCTTIMPTRSDAENQSLAFAEAAGCAGVDGQLECLGGKSASDLLIPAPSDGATEDLPGGSVYAGGTPRWRFAPTVDGSFLVEQPRASFDSGDIAEVPYILGSNSDEGTLFHISAPPVETEQEYLDALDRRFGANAGAIAAVYPADQYPTPNDALVRVTGDAFLVCGTLDSAKRAAAAGSPVYMYNFAREVPIPGLGATHGGEIAYVFDSAADPPADDQTVSGHMRGYWSRFAATGDPNGGGAATWPSFETRTDRRINIDVEVSPLENFRQAECELWTSLHDAEF